MVLYPELQALALWVGIPLVLAGMFLWIWVLRGAAAKRGGPLGVEDVIAQSEADGTVPPE